MGIYWYVAQECTCTSVITICAHPNVYSLNKNEKGDKVEIQNT